MPHLCDTFGSILLIPCVGTVVEVVNKPVLVSASKRYADARSPLRAWCNEMEDGVWKTPVELKEQFPNACTVCGDLVVFNIIRNRYRLVARINFQKDIVFVRFFGTQGDCDDIIAEEV